MILFGLAVAVIISWAMMLVGWDMAQKDSGERWGTAIGFLGFCMMVVSTSLFILELST
jgi:hypothetical protein